MDISAEIAAIQAASQGSELRQPLVGALNKLNSGTLPTVTASDAGKILKVGANGWEVGEKSGYMPVPSAVKQITENGTHDVTNYASAVVNVSSGGQTNVLSGTFTPTASMGTDGDIYIQYTDEDIIGYLENSASAYINTGYVAKTTSKFVMKCNISGGQASLVPFGARSAATGAASAGGVYTIRGDNAAIGYCYGNALTQDFNSSYNSFLNKDIEITLDASHTKITDEIDTVEYTFTGGIPTQYPIFLFGLNQAGTNLSICNAYMKLYEFGIYENSILIHKYIPALVNDAICLKDEISGSVLEPYGTMTGIPTVLANTIISTFLKVNGTWKSLIGSDINDVTTR